MYEAKKRLFGQALAVAISQKLDEELRELERLEKQEGKSKLAD